MSSRRPFTGVPQALLDAYACDERLGDRARVLLALFRVAYDFPNDGDEFRTVTQAALEERTGLDRRSVRRAITDLASDRLATEGPPGRTAKGYSFSVPDSPNWRATAPFVSRVHAMIRDSSHEVLRERSATPNGALAAGPNGATAGRLNGATADELLAIQAMETQTGVPMSEGEKRAYLSTLRARQEERGNGWHPVASVLAGGPR